jgi:type II secretory pathway component GspD/PulD (secretin)
VTRGDSTLVTLYAPYVNSNVGTVTTFSSTGILYSSNIVPFTLELPKLEVNALKSTVMLPDKGTLLIGGFTSARQERTHSGVPFLSHIPFLGRLFSKNGTYDQNRRAFFLLSAEVFDQNEREKQR